MNIPISWRIELTYNIQLDVIIATKPVIHNSFAVNYIIKSVIDKEMILDMIIISEEDFIEKTCGSHTICYN